jgi:hypothetical protein
MCTPLQTKQAEVICGVTCDCAPSSKAANTPASATSDAPCSAHQSCKFARDGKCACADGECQASKAKASCAEAGTCDCGPGGCAKGELGLYQSGSFVGSEAQGGFSTYTDLSCSYSQRRLSLPFDWPTRRFGASGGDYSAIAQEFHVHL